MFRLVCFYLKYGMISPKSSTAETHDFLCHVIDVAQKSHRPSKNRIQRSLSAGYPGGFGGFGSECIICRKTAIVVVVVVLVLVLVLVIILVLCCRACPRRTVIPPFQYIKKTHEDSMVYRLFCCYNVGCWMLRNVSQQFDFNA